MNTTKYLLPALLAPMLCTAVPIASNPLAPRVARAAGGATSTLAGIAMPRGGAAYGEVNANYLDLLSSVAKEKSVALTPSGDEPEVFLWRGDSYREDRVAFTKSALQRALEGAGWQIKEVDEVKLRDVNVFASFDTTNGKTLPFSQSTTKRHNFFQASNAKLGRAFLAAWLESDDALALGLLPVEFVAPKVKAAPPKVAAGAFVIQDANDVTKGMPRPKLPTFPKVSPKPGTVRGVALDGAGKPLANVRVAVYSSVGGGVRTTHTARTNAQGAYQVLVPAGICEVAQADVKRSYNGAELNLLLQPASGEYKQFNSAQGHVEHLILRTSGEAGGTVRVRTGMDNSDIEVTLTPIGKLLDGSAGRTLVLRYNTGTQSDKYINGVPLGRYRLSARLFDDGEALPLRAGFLTGYDADTSLSASRAFDFKPGYTFSQYNPGKSSRDVQHVLILLEP